MKFDHIIGHEKIIQNFKNAIVNKSIAHSYIFEGPRSIGKKTTAIALAKVLLGEQTKEDNQPDLVMLDKAGKTIKNDDIENLQRDIITKPFKGDRKIYIICGAENMTTRAQNRFLKTLEEPPDYVTIIMTTENKDKFLPTIVSRCQLVTFNYVSTKKIEDMLVAKYNNSQEKATFIANFSNGIVGRAVCLSEDDSFIELRNETIKSIDTTVMESKEKIFTTSEFFEKNKEDIGEILDIMLFYFRDLIIYNETQNLDHIINADKIEYIKKHKNHLEKNALHDIIKTITNTKENINLKVNYSLNIEIMLLEIQEVEYGSCSRN